MMLILWLAAAACSGPRVSGIGIFQHNVSVGQEVVVQLPFDPQTGAGWRLVSFDSSMLRPTGRETVLEGDSRFVFRFEARTRGKTQILFEEVASDGSVRKKDVTVRIRQIGPQETTRDSGW